MERNNKTWVVVANSALAKYYKVVKFPKIEEISSLEHPESRLKDSELVSERPGRSFNRVGTGRHAYEPETDPKKYEAEKFAKMVGDKINEAYLSGQFSRLYLIASPTFLGLLRPYLHSKISATIVNEIPKDIVDHSAEEIERHLTLS